MTNTQFALLLAAIWLSPHNHRSVAAILGLLFVGFAVAIEMEWL